MQIRIDGVPFGDVSHETLREAIDAMVDFEVARLKNEHDDLARLREETTQPSIAVKSHLVIGKRITYTCGCEQSGDMVDTFCPMHGNPEAIL